LPLAGLMASPEYQEMNLVEKRIAWDETAEEAAKKNYLRPAPSGKTKWEKKEEKQKEKYD